MAIKINFGCGNAPIKDWLNIDNSPAIKLANSPILYGLIKSFKLINTEQAKNVEWNKVNKILFADATKKMQFQDNTVDCIYTSHMLEHLSRDEAIFFLTEAYRVLKKNAILRVAIPDLRKLIDCYINDGNATKFMEKMHTHPPKLDNLKSKLQLFAYGYRQHQWMYDGSSLSLLLKKLGFISITILKAGDTLLKNPGELDLHERSEDSIYVECLK